MKKKVAREEFDREVLVQTRSLMNVANEIISRFSKRKQQNLRYTFSTSFSIEPIPEVDLEVIDKEAKEE